MATNTKTITAVTKILATLTKVISSNSHITSTGTSLLPKCSEGLLSSLAVEIIDEDLSLKVTGGTVYLFRNQNLLEIPKVRIRSIDPTTGIETPLYEAIDYTINHVAGELTLTVATANTIRVEYFYKPLTDKTIDTLLEQSITEISVEIHRPINHQSIPSEYQPAICRRLTTNVLKTLQVETRDFFAISIAGRSISKDQVPTHFDLLMKDNETTLRYMITQLRHFNNTARLE